MPPYRLQTLLELRERAQEEAEKAFSNAVRALEKEKAEQTRLEEELEKRKAERKQKVTAYLQQVMARGAGVNGLTLMNRHEERLKDEEAQLALEVERQKEAVQSAEQWVEQKRREMAETAKELKAIEKHKENWKKQVKYERQQREEMTQEEIGQALFQARQRK